MISRRSLFKKTLGGAALLAAAGAVPVALRRTRLRPSTPALRFFDAAEYAIWAAVAERILAREATAATQERSDGPPMPAAAHVEASEHRAAPPSPADLDVAARADAFLAPLPETDRRDLKRLLALFDNALFSLLSGGPPRPFTQMTPLEQDRRLRDWQTSRLAVKRTGFQAMKRLSCALYFSDPATYASVGYPGPPVELVRSVLGAKEGAR